MESWRLNLLGGDVLVAPSGESLSPKHQTTLNFVRLIGISGASGVLSEAAAYLLCNDQWEDPMFGLRNQLARLNQRALKIHPVAIAERNGNRIRFIQGAVSCDLWELVDKVAALKSSNPALEREALDSLDQIDPELLRVALDAATIPRYVETVTLELLQVISNLSILPSAPTRRLKLLRVAAVIKEYLEPSTHSIETLMRFYAACNCRQELLQTYLDYEGFLLDEFGEHSATKIRELSEVLLAKLDAPSRQRRHTPPPAPILSFGSDEHSEKLQALIHTGGHLYVGGVAGVGKTHLLRRAVADQSLSLHSVGWIDLANETPEDIQQILPSFNADIIVLDGYRPEFASTIRFVRRVCKYHALIVAGCSAVGYDYESSVTVQPLEVGTADNPGPATLMLEQLAGVSGQNKVRQSSILLAQQSCGIPLCIYVLAGLAQSFGMTSVSGQMSALLQNQGSGMQVLTVALKETIAQFGSTARTGIEALAGLRERVPFSIVLKELNLDLLNLKQLADCGLITLNSEQKDVRISDSIIEFLQHDSSFVPDNQSQIDFENSLAKSTLENGLACENDERVAAHAKVCTLVASQLIRRKEYDLAFKLLSKLRPFLGIIRESRIDPSVLHQEVFIPECDSAALCDRALSVGILHLHRFEFSQIEALIHEVMDDPRFSTASDKHKIELHSQLGLGLRGRGAYEESIKTFDHAISMLDPAAQPALYLKLLYNKTLTLTAHKRYQEALTTIRVALEYANYAPNDDARVELLHMEAVNMRDANEDEKDVRERLLVALAFARMYKLPVQEGWILQNAAKSLTTLLTPAQAVVIGAAGMEIQMQSGFTADFRRHAKGTCELIYECLKGEKYEALALEAKLIQERLSDIKLYQKDVDIYRNGNRSEFTSPIAIEQTPIHPGELQSLIAACIRILGDSPEIAVVVRDWGLDFSNWIAPAIASRLQTQAPESLTLSAG